MSRVSLLASAIIYGNSLATSQTHYQSCDQYIAFKKAQVIAGSTNGPGPVPSIIVTDLQEAGCLSVAASKNRPGPPTDVLVLYGNGTATVSWTPPLDDGGLPILSYSVTITPIISGLGPLVAITGPTVIVALQSPLVITGLTNGTSYTITVGATNSLGTSSRITAGLAPGSPATPVGAPGPPTNVVADASDESIIVSWSPPVTNGGSPITKYTITTTPGATVMDVSANITSINKTGLTNGVTYIFSITATTAINVSSVAFSNPAIPARVPDPPTNVVATSNATQIIVTWTPPLNNGGSPIINYTVTRFPDSVSRTGISPMVFTDVVGGVSYTFSVVSRNSAAVSAPSALSNAVILGQPPGRPTGVTATPGDARATVNWTAPVNTGGLPILYYTVTSNPGAVTATSTGTTAVVVGLQNSVPYTFTVVAVTSFGPSAASLASNSVTPIGGPAPPTGVYAIVGTNSEILTGLDVLVNWIAPTSTGGLPILSYAVTSNPDAVTVTSTGTTAVVPNLRDAITYTFTVVAVTAFGPSVASLPSEPVTTNGRPDPPTAVYATAGEASATISWTPPLNDNGFAITSYKVVSSPGDISANTGSTFIDLSGLVAGTSYGFYVTAINSVGASNPSTISNSVIPFIRPTAPTSVSAVAGDGSAIVTWSGANDNGSTIISYTVTSAPEGLVRTGFSPFNFRGLTNGTLYTFTVKSQNIVGFSTPSIASNAVRPVAPPNIPFNVNAIAGDTVATVTWDASGNGGSPLPSSYVVSAYTVFIAYDASNNPYYDLSANPFTSQTVSSIIPVTFTGLTNGESYAFTVTAINDGRSSFPSSNSEPVTPGRVADTPILYDLSANNIIYHGAKYYYSEPDRADIFWDASANTSGFPITSYTVFAYPNGSLVGTSYIVIPTLVPVLPPYYIATIYGLTHGVTYTFTVTATNSLGTSAPSANTGQVIAGIIYPPPPAIYTTPGDSQVVVQWPLPSEIVGFPITGFSSDSLPGALVPSQYVVYNPITDTYQYAQHPTADPTHDVSGATIILNNPVGQVLVFPGVQNGRYYRFNISTNANYGGDSGIAQSTTSSPTLPRGAPDAPIINIVTNSGGTSAAFMTCYWSFPANNGTNIISYTVTATPILSMGPTENPSFPSGTTSGAIVKTVSYLYNSASFDRLMFNTYYSFTMVATNAIGTSISSVPFIGYTGYYPAASVPPSPPFFPPVPPVIQDVSGIPGPSGIVADVSWNQSSTYPPITQYTITVNPGGIITVINNPFATVGYISGLAYNTSYNISMTSTNSEGTSSVSNTKTLFVASGGPLPPVVVLPPLTYTVPSVPKSVNATQLPTIPPPKPTIGLHTGAVSPITTVDAGNIRVDWTAPDSSGGSVITMYSVAMYLGSYVYSTVTDVSGNVTTATVQAPVGIPVAFYVFASNAAGSSPPSAISNYATAL